jgi:hypothetical protein
VDRRHLERRLVVERRQDRGKSLREHRLARTGRAKQEQVMAAGRSDLDRPPAVGLPDHVDQVDPRRPGR